MNKRLIIAVASYLIFIIVALLVEMYHLNLWYGL